MKFVVRGLVSVGVVWALYLLRANGLVLYYPALMVAIVLAAFAYSLFHVPLCEVVARRMGETLDDRGVGYCRKATVAWTIFLALHFAVTVATVFASREIWVVYNGAVAYALLGLMFGGEWLVRRRVKRRG